MLALWAPSWPMLALSWPYVGPMLASVGAMLAISAGIQVARPPRRQFFRPGPFRGSQNHVKTAFFFASAKKKNEIGPGHETPRFSPHLCVGFLILVLHPVRRLLRILPSPASSRHTQLVLTHNLSTHHFSSHHFSSHHLSSHHLSSHYLSTDNCSHTT